MKECDPTPYKFCIKIKSFFKTYLEMSCDKLSSTYNSKLIWPRKFKILLKYKYIRCFLNILSMSQALSLFPFYHLYCCK